MLFKITLHPNHIWLLGLCGMGIVTVTHKLPSPPLSLSCTQILQRHQKEGSPLIQGHIPFLQPEKCAQLHWCMCLEIACFLDAAELKKGIR